ISDPNVPADVRQRRSAFPSNCVHSLGAMHMMLTAFECCTQGLTFVSVHGSYCMHTSGIDADKTS
ncbi:hypothetical protein EDB19DRAFT_1651233, partial [Suillus lakei]